jgi:hypothetical protein
LQRRICTAALAFALSYSGRKRAHSAEFAAPSLSPIGGGAEAEFERYRAFSRNKHRSARFD